MSRRVRPAKALAVAALLVLAALGAGLALVTRQRSVFPTATPPVPVANEAFRSASDPQAPATIWAVGDGADGGADSRRVVDLMDRGDAARVLSLGDVYEAGSPEQFRRNVGEVYGPLLSRIAPTPGNHDWPAHARGYDPFWRGVTGAPTPPWYAFSIGGWRLLSVNSETPDDPRQLAWLAKEMRTAHQCVLAFMHRPRFNAGRHGDAPDTDPLWLLLQGRAALVLAGHDHNMQRLRPVAGTALYISGAGGHSHYGVNDQDPRLAFSNDDDDGALKLDLRPGFAALTFVDVDGRVLDRSTQRCPGRAAGR